MSCGVVYFSRDNNTKAGAEYLASVKNAVLVRLLEEKPCSVLGGVWKALFRKASRLVGRPWEEVRDCEELYLLTPVWAGSSTPAMNAFLQKADFTGKLVTIITFQADPNLSGSSKTHAQIKAAVEQKGGRVAAAYACHGGGLGVFAGKDYIEEQIMRILQQANNTD